MRYVAGDPYLRPLTIWASLVNLGLTGYGALAVVFLVRTVGLAAGPAGLLLAASGAGGLLGALVAGGIAVKAGLLKGLWVGILALKKFIIIGALALARYFKRIWNWIRGNPPAEVAVLPAPPPDLPG